MPRPKPRSFSSPRHRSTVCPVGDPCELDPAGMTNTPMVHAPGVIAAYGGSAEEMVRRRVSNVRWGGWVMPGMSRMRLYSLRPRRPNTLVSANPEASLHSNSARRSARRRFRRLGNGPRPAMLFAGVIGVSKRLEDGRLRRVLWSDNLDGKATTISMRIWCRGDGMIVATRWWGQARRGTESRVCSCGAVAANHVRSRVAARVRRSHRGRDQGWPGGHHRLRHRE